ncbi:MAG TPA: pyridoxal-dependent decarboxylase, partial [Anaerolineae bacterium]
MPGYSRRAALMSAPKDEMPEYEMLPETAYGLIKDELIMDGSSRINLATFCQTWMEPEARQLMIDMFDKNMIDKDEYPQTAEMEERCVRMLANLWHAPHPETTIGTSTIGSSEACMLGGMALKWRWREKMRKQNKPTDKHNIVMGINVQVCWHKFARYWDIEERLVPVEGDRFVLSAAEAVKLCDEN